MDRITKAMERARDEHQERNVRPLPSMSVENTGGGLNVHEVSISREVLANNKIITALDNGEFIQAYKVLRTRIWQQMRGNGWSTLAITSANPGEGKTLTAINLAVSLALMEASNMVVLVDLDLRSPSIHDYFGFWPENGVGDYMQGRVAIEDVMMDPGIGEFIMLPGNVPITNSSEIISSAKMQRLLQEIKSRFPSRLVIFDLPPVLATDDVLALAPSIDAFLFVIEEGGSTTSDIKRAIDLLSGVNMIGTVLNRSEESSARYNY